jgi:co-chaperonin GroES (HSP10)
MQMNQFYLIALFLLLTSTLLRAQAVSINTDGAAADPSAMLDVKSTDKGVLVPRMSKAQRELIAAPATGLLVYDTDTNSFRFFNGTSWINLGGGGGTPTTSIADTDGNTKVQTEETANEDIIRFDLGGTERMVLRQNAGGSPRLELPNLLGNTYLGQDAGFTNTSGESNTGVGRGALYFNTTGEQNSALGRFALNSNTTGNNNTAGGAYALHLNTTGARNTALGRAAMDANTTGSSNTATGNEALRYNETGSFNTAHGRGALYANTTGTSSVAIGYDALYSNTDRSFLVAVGDSALYNNGLGASASFEAVRNTAVGSKALFSNTTGHSNTAHGFHTLEFNTTGDNNTASGRNALASNTIGTANTANGSNTLFSNTSGSSNVAIGMRALYSNTDRSNLVAVGDSALYNNGIGTSFSTDATNNTAIGSKALFANTIGYFNTAVGAAALRDNTTGDENTAIGAYTLYSNTTGERNIAIGSEVLSSNTSGYQNIAVGWHAMLENTTGVSNTAVGVQSMRENTYGIGNTAVGIGSLNKNTNGDYNTAIGNGALDNNYGGSSNTALGHDADITNNISSNATAIGANALAGASNTLVLGSINGVNGATASVNVGIGTTTPELKLHIVGGTDVGLSGGGYIQTGLTTGSNLVIDNNEIMARNNGGASNLLINFFGGNVGIGRTPATNVLEISGAASKSTAGDWLANSDVRLKKNISPLNSHEMLDKLLALQGVTYEWNDNKTGSKRPLGVQYGFTAQNIQTVFPTLVEEDKLGYLQTAYGTYDAMTVEAIRALNNKIAVLEKENTRQKTENAEMKAQLDKITAALQTAGIGAGN